MCIVCRKSFPDKISFTQHKHPTCQICNRRVVSLGLHLKSHPKCHRCGEYFKSEGRLVRHIAREHRQRWEPRETSPRESSHLETCPICDQRIDQRFLERHIQEFHPTNVDQDQESHLLSEDETMSDASSTTRPQSVELDSDTTSVKTVESVSDTSSVELDSDATSVKTVESVSTINDENWSDAASIETVESNASTLSVGREVVPIDYSFSEDEIECPKCNLSFPSQALLNSHMKVHKKATAVFQCEICKDILKTRGGYRAHMESHKRHECNMCAAQFNSTDDRDMHMSMNHPMCTKCNIAFTTIDEYLRHNQREHPKDNTYDGPHLSSESEDPDSDEDSLAAEDRLFHKHINCVTIDRFMKIRDLIEKDQFDTLANDEELLEALQIIFKGVIKGYIPICAPQRMVLTKRMKKLVYTFGRRPSATLLKRNRKDIKQLFRVLWSSVDRVIKSYNKFV